MRLSSAVLQAAMLALTCSAAALPNPQTETDIQAREQSSETGGRGGAQGGLADAASAAAAAGNTVADSPVTGKVIIRVHFESNGQDAYNQQEVPMYETSGGSGAADLPTTSIKNGGNAGSVSGVLIANVIPNKSASNYQLHAHCVVGGSATVEEHVGEAAINPEQAAGGIVCYTITGEQT